MLIAIGRFFRDRYKVWERSLENGAARKADGTFDALESGRGSQETDREKQTALPCFRTVKFLDSTGQCEMIGPHIVQDL